MDSLHVSSSYTAAGEKLPWQGMVAAVSAAGGSVR